MTVPVDSAVQAAPSDARSVPARRALLRVAASLGTRDAVRIRAAMVEARDAAPSGAVDEVLLQSHLFVGFPDALNALGLWREVSGTDAPASADEDPATWDGARRAGVRGGVRRQLREAAYQRASGCTPTWTGGWPRAAMAG